MNVAVSPGSFPNAGHGEADAARGAWTRAGAWFLFALALYFGLHLAGRTLVSDSLQLDEAEQVFLTQDWRWGYGAQPPLYTWMQKGLFSLFGLNVFALSLMKNGLLFSLYLFVFLAAREALDSERLAVVAAASLCFIPQISWTAQRDGTHLVLANVCSAATLLVFLRLLKRGRWGWYAGLGALIGLGALSKYNYIFFPAALLLASSTMGRFRRVVFRRELWLSGLTLALVVGPHLYWMLLHQDLVLSQRSRLDLDAGNVPAFLGALGAFVSAVFLVVVVPILIYLPLLWRVRQRKDGPAREWDDRLLLVWRTLLMAMGLWLIVSLVLGSTTHERWLGPLLFPLPILLVGCVRSQLTSSTERLLLIIAGVVALVVLCAINLTALGANWIGRAHNLQIPHAEVATALRAEGFEEGKILVSGRFLAGNLKMQFKNHQVVMAERPEAPLGPGEKGLLLWDANARDAPPKLLLAAAREFFGVEPSERDFKYVETEKRNGPKRSHRVGFWLFRGADR